MVISYRSKWNKEGYHFNQNVRIAQSEFHKYSNYVNNDKLVTKDKTIYYLNLTQTRQMSENLKLNLKTRNTTLEVTKW